VTERGEICFGEAPEPPQRPAVLEQAVEALKELLDGGPVPAQEVIEDLKDQGISEPTARRAKAKLGVVSSRQGEGWTWGLPVDRDEPACAED
jgi:hypothetical protein